MELYFVRHGESISNARGVMEGWGDSDLSDRGREQARRIAERLSALGRFDTLVCSPLRRARHTASIIGQALGRIPLVESDLREIHIGALDGRRVADLDRHYPDELRRWAAEDADLVFPGGERLGGFYERAIRAVEFIRKSGLRRIVVVSHGGMLSACLTLLLEGQASSRYGTSLKNCSLSGVRLGTHGAEVLCFNDCSHLSETA